jgi:hypothetical protein
MVRKLTREFKKKYSNAANQVSRDTDWDEIAKFLKVAEDNKIPDNQLKKAWTDLARDQIEKNDLTSALISLSSARRHALDDQQLLAEILKCLAGVYAVFQAKFSREDLLHLESALNRLYSFHKTRENTTEENLERAKELLTSIEHSKQLAPSLAKTPATQDVLRIYSALYPNMTQEEVAAEFARIVAPLIREELSKKKKPRSSPQNDKEGGKKKAGK